MEDRKESNDFWDQDLNRQDQEIVDQDVSAQDELLISFKRLLIKGTYDYNFFHPLEFKTYRNNTIMDVKYLVDSERFIYMRIQDPYGEHPKCLHIQDHDGNII